MRRLISILSILSPAYAAVPAQHIIPASQVTEPPTIVDRTPTPVFRRDLASYLSSALGSLGSNVPSAVASSFANLFQAIPSGGSVLSAVGLSELDIVAIPTNALNIP